MIRDSTIDSLLLAAIVLMAIGLLGGTATVAVLLIRRYWTQPDSLQELPEPQLAEAAI
jgi:hypothetical protein